MRQCNWGKYDSWYPASIVYPNGVEDIRSSIEEAKRRQVTIKAAGALHSLNSIAATSGIQLKMDRLDRILKVDRDTLTVKVEGGIVIKKLLRELGALGLALPNQGYIMDQTIAGAIATATHGSGNTGTLSSFVEEIELIDAFGNFHLLSPRSNSHLFSAAVVNLGCLGVIYSLSLKCKPLFKLHLSKKRVNAETSIKNASASLLTNDFFQIALDPYGEDAIEWRYTISDKPIQNRLQYQVRRNLIKSFVVPLFDVCHPPSALMPYALKPYMYLSPWESCVDYAFRLLSPADEGHYIEEEVAIPIELLEEGIRVTMELHRSYVNRGVAFLGIILVRFADPETYGYLSPAFGRKTAYISLISIPRPGYSQFFREFETEMYRLSGRPHWGKVNFLTYGKIKDLYGDRLDRFIQARKELDPHGLFSSPHIEKLLSCCI